METIRYLFHRKPSKSFQILSDLHLEVGQQYLSFEIPPSAPYLILAGDIGRLIDYESFLSFLRKQVDTFDLVFFVLGNHEFYGLSYQHGVEKAQQMLKEPSLKGKVKLLHRTRFDVPQSDVTILGCTLWSKITDDAKDVVRMRVKDFQKIGNWTIEKHNEIHVSEVSWLKEQINAVQNEATQDGGSVKRKVLIVTHHAPSVLNTSGPSQVGNAWSSAFATDVLSQDKWPGLKLWVFGHTHFTCDFRLSDIRVKSNQRGYVLPGSRPQKAPGKIETQGFDARCVEPWLLLIENCRIALKSTEAMSNEAADLSGMGDQMYDEGIGKIRTNALAIQMLFSDLTDNKDMFKQVVQLLKVVKQAQNLKSIPKIEEIVCNIQILLEDLDGDNDMPILQHTVEIARVVKEMKINVPAPRHQQQHRYHGPTSKQSHPEKVQGPKFSSGPRSVGCDLGSLVSAWEESAMIDLVSEDEEEGEETIKKEPSHTLQSHGLLKTAISSPKPTQHSEPNLSTKRQADTRSHIRETPPAHIPDVKSNELNDSSEEVDIKEEDFGYDEQDRSMSDSQTQTGAERLQSPILSGSLIGGTPLGSRTAMKEDDDEDSDLTDPEDLDFGTPPPLTTHAKSANTKRSPPPYSPISQQSLSAKRVKLTLNNRRLAASKKPRPDVYDGPESEWEPDDEDEDDKKPGWKRLIYGEVAHTILAAHGKGIWVDEWTLKTDAKKVYVQRGLGVAFNPQSLFSALNGDVREAASSHNPIRGQVEKKTDTLITASVQKKEFGTTGCADWMVSRSHLLICVSCCPILY